MSAILTTGFVEGLATSISFGVPVTDVTPTMSVPFEASVIRPFVSTVMFAFVYEPGETAVFARLMIGSPEAPSPLTTVTFPAVPVIVRGFKVDPLYESMPEPAN